MKKNWDETPEQRAQAAYDFPYEITEDTGHILRAPAKKLPYTCRFCTNHFAYPWTRDRHLRKAHAALLPGPQPAQSTGPVPCRWCPNGYRTQVDLSLHERAVHARNLALLIGLDRPL